MDWYYEGNGEQQGPVPEAVLIDLYHQGKLTGDSRVWRQGMSDWDLMSESFPSLDQVICSGCNEYVDESSIVPAGDLSVCPSCKDEVLQRMREGIPLTQDSNFREIRENLPITGPFFFDCALALLQTAQPLTVSTPSLGAQLGKSSGLGS
ncbi:MAG: GYF domain-containing protein [Verrucomicrobiota bacterium]